MTTKELIEEAVALPLEQRVMLVDILLQSLNQPEAEIDREWGALAQHRLQEIREGKVEAVAGQEVFQRIHERFGQWASRFIPKRRRSSGRQSEGYFDALERIARPALLQGATVHDARVAALCLFHGVRVLWSADRDFSRFPELTVVNPLRRG